MEDFATFCKNKPRKKKQTDTFFKNMPMEFKEPRQVARKPVTAKQASWLTKNRLWNFVFWFGMSLGLTLASFTKFTLEMPNLASAINWSTLLGVPLLVVLASRTRTTGKDSFVNSENIALTKKQLPTSNFIWLTILGIGFTFLVTETILPKKLPGFFDSLIFFSCLFSGFSLYFIFKNCPVSILFNRKCWHYMSDNAPTRPKRPNFHSSKNPNKFYNDIRYSAGKSYHPSNIYYSSTHRR